MYRAGRKTLLTHSLTVVCLCQVVGGAADGGKAWASGADHSSVTVSNYSWHPRCFTVAVTRSVIK